MMTLTASPRTIKTPATITSTRRTQANAAKAPARPGFLTSLLRALATAAV
jgi:hypothetical protein